MLLIFQILCGVIIYLYVYVKSEVKSQNIFHLKRIHFVILNFLIKYFKGYRIDFELRFLYKHVYWIYYTF